MDNKKTFQSVLLGVPTTTTRPANPWLRVLVHGLVIGAFKKQSQDVYHFDLGALAPSPTGHSLSLSLLDRDSGVSKYSGTPANIGFSVTGATAGITQYQHNPGQQRFDLDWVADFEGNELFKDKCKKKPHKLSPRLSIESGVVYTAIRSAPLIKAKNGSSLPWRRIAQVIAVDIDDGTSATLRVDGQAYTVNKSDRKNYNLVLRNDCGSSCSTSSPAGGASDINHLFTASDPPASNPHVITIHDDPSCDTACKQALLAQDIRDLGNNPIEQQRYLRGLEQVFFPRMQVTEKSREREDEVAAATRYDPCGMGFYGDSDGLDDGQ